MLPREPGPPGLQIRGPAQLQIADHARQDEVHLLQPAPLLLQRLPLGPEEVQSLPGVLPPQTAADLRQRRAGLPEDGDSVKIIELFRVVIKISVLPPVGREQEAKVLIVPQSLLGSAAQGGEGAGGHPSPMFHKIFSPKSKIPLDCVAATRFMIPHVEPDGNPDIDKMTENKERPTWKINWIPTIFR